MATNLAAGDLAIIGVNADDPDNFSFVLLVDVQAGTQVIFADCGVKSDGTFRGSEGAQRWTAPSDLPAGAVVNLAANAAQFTALTDAVITGAFSLSTSGDQIIAFQGTGAAPTYLYALTFDRNAFGSDATSATNTAMPPGLTSQTAVARGQAASEWDDVVYNGPTTGTKADLLAAIANSANWLGSNDLLTQSTTNFTVTSGPAQTLAIAADSAVKPEGNAGTSDFTFTVTRTDPNADTTASWQISGAANAADFVATSGTVSFTSGDTVKTITVQVKGDTTFEPDEGFTVTLSAATGGAVITAASASGTIQNDDAVSSVINGVTVLDQAPSLQGHAGTPTATNALNVTRIGSVDSGVGAGGAESISFDPASKRAFVTNPKSDTIDILDLANPAAPSKIGTISLGTLPGYGEVNSVAVKDGIVAVAIQNATGWLNGFVALFDTDGNLIRTLDVGAQPDELTFSPNGLLLVANEGERFVEVVPGGTDVVHNAPGSVSIIDVSLGAAAATVRNTIAFTALDGNE